VARPLPQLCGPARRRGATPSPARHARARRRPPCGSICGDLFTLHYPNLTLPLPTRWPPRAPGSLATLVIRELDGAGSKRLLAAASPADALAPYDLAVFVFDSGARAGPPPGGRTAVSDARLPPGRRGRRPARAGCLRAGSEAARQAQAALGARCAGLTRARGAAAAPGVLGSLRAAAALLARVASASGDVLPTLLLAAKDDLGMAPARPPPPCAVAPGRRRAREHRRPATARGSAALPRCKRGRCADAAAAARSSAGTWPARARPGAAGAPGRAARATLPYPTHPRPPVQEVEGEAAGVCAELGLPLPLGVARREAPGRRLAGALLAALEQPERDLPIPLTASLKARAPLALAAHTRHVSAGLASPRAEKRAAPARAGSAQTPPSPCAEAGWRPAGPALPRRGP
jgi:hypothetical protein